MENIRKKRTTSDTIEVKGNFPVRRCTKCGEWRELTIEHFHRNKHNAYGFSAMCAICENERSAKNRELKRQKELELEKQTELKKPVEELKEVVKEAEQKVEVEPVEKIVADITFMMHYIEKSINGIADDMESEIYKLVDGVANKDLEEVLKKVDNIRDMVYVWIQQNSKYQSLKTTKSKLTGELEWQDLRI